MKRCRIGFALLLLAASSAVMTPRAEAMDKRVKTVFTTAGYGTVAGSVLGFALFPFTTNPRHIFMGASLGLWSGIGLGVYFVVYRLQGTEFFFKPRQPRAPDQPGGGPEYYQNDLNDPGSTYEMDDPVEPDLESRAPRWEGWRAPRSPWEPQPPLAEVRIPVLWF